MNKMVEKLMAVHAWASARGMGKLAAFLFALIIALMAQSGYAQDTGTNTVTLIGNNLTNGSNVLTPIAIGIIVIWLVVRLAKKIGSKAG